jgi:hypothetical protein
VIVIEGVAMPRVQRRRGSADEHRVGHHFLEARR